MRVLIFFFICMLIPAHCEAQKNVLPKLKNVKRILFLGNSITYTGNYIVDIENFVITAYPFLKIEFINAGLPSETVSGLSEDGHASGAFPRPDLHERLRRLLQATKPDLIFACYGMNDGIYLPLDTGRFQKFKEGISWLHEIAMKSGVKIIHVTPSWFDEHRGGHPGYSHVLDVYTDWMLDRQALGWNVADIHTPMKQFLEHNRMSDSTFNLAEDGVHPGAVGHWIIAKSILRYLGVVTLENIDRVEDLLSSVKNGQEIYLLVAKRQSLMKDAWLTHTHHTRPGMQTGLPMSDARKKAKGIERKIRHLLK